MASAGVLYVEIVVNSSKVRYSAIYCEFPFLAKWMASLALFAAVLQRH